MRKRILYIAILSGLTIFIAFSVFWYITSNGIVDWTIPKKENVRLRTEIKDKTKIAEMLMESYLKPYRSIFVSHGKRLKDFTIHKIDHVVDENGSFNFVVKYSVKPYLKENSYWSVGNGMPQDDGWIKNKIAFVYGKKDSNNYSLVSLGTGP